MGRRGQQHGGQQVGPNAGKRASRDVSFFYWAIPAGTMLHALGLPIFSYLTLIYRELGDDHRAHSRTPGIFEAEIEPKLKIIDAAAAAHFASSGTSGLAFLVLETTRGVVYFVPGTWNRY